ncbi:hypothetical protein ACS0TY_027870 [Phlomoides rotata]
MAALRHGGASSSAAIDHLQFTPEKINPIKPVLLISSFSSSFPAKRTRRKNHLRQKILKTLRKPFIPKLPPANPILPIDSPPQEIEETGNFQEIQESEISEAGNEEVQKFVELTEGSVPSSVGVNGNVGILANNSILKYVLWMVGAFAFQTVCAVWVFGSADIDDKSELLKESGESRVKIYLNGNGVGKMRLKDSDIGPFGYVDELEMERKVEEIRVMAREARETERLESKRKGIGSEESDGGKYFKSGIEEEVDNRLVKLRKKLGNAYLKMPVASVGDSGKGNERRDGVEKGELDDGESNGALLFKKKHRFKGLLGADPHPMEKPKGFSSDDNRLENGNLEKENELFSNGNVDDNVVVGSRDGGKPVELSDVDQKGIDDVRVVEEDSKKEMSERTESTKNTRKKVGKGRGRSKQGTGKVVAKPKVVDGIALEKDNGGSAQRPVKPRKLNGEAVKSREQGALDTAIVSKKPSKGNDTLRGKGFGDSKSAIKSESETDFWWLNLPYALAILMRRGTDGEGGEGLYTLRTVSNTEEQISHMVAFEDHADATNFCSLLQSFFEDLELEDFKADVVPLTIKELNEALKLFDDKVLVVRRGQLKLYAGQPLTDAEMALRAMIEKG